MKYGKCATGPASKSGSVTVGDILYEVDGQNGMLNDFVALSSVLSRHDAAFWQPYLTQHACSDVGFIQRWNADVKRVNQTTVHRSTLSHVSKHLLGPNGSVAKVSFLRGGEFNSSQDPL